MKKITILLAGCLALTGCGPEHVRDEVREVQVADTIISDGYQDIVWTPGVNLNVLDDESEPELYVNILDVATGQAFKIDLGTECSQFPLPKGQRFLARFNVLAYKEKPRELYMNPYGQPINKLLCS
jgi:hypothetical protein